MQKEEIYTAENLVKNTKERNGYWKKVVFKTGGRNI